MPDKIFPGQIHQIMLAFRNGKICVDSPPEHGMFALEKIGLYHTAGTTVSDDFAGCVFEVLSTVAGFMDEIDAEYMKSLDTVAAGIG